MPPQLSGNGRFPPSMAIPADNTASSESTHHADASPLESCGLPVTPQALGSSESLEFFDDGTGDMLKKVEDGVYNLSIVDTDVHRYHGKSSGLAFLQSAIGPEHGHVQHRQHESQRAKPVCVYVRI